MGNDTPHILIFEPRADGHHLTWLRLIAQGFLSLGMRVTLALDARPEAMVRIRSELGAVMAQVAVLPVFDDAGRYREENKLKTMAGCLRESGAGELFLPNLDEIASGCLRWAAIGIYPPKALKSRLSGVYHRPRSLASPSKPLGNRIKTIGMRHLGRNGWCRNIYLVDEYLYREVKGRYPGLAFHFIPDPGFGNFDIGRDEAREALGIPVDKFVFLNYGIPARRKGLHLVVRAMLEMDAESDAFLFCAGRTAQDSEVAEGLETLVQRGAASVMGRYITDEEEKLSFCACDAVLLPYIGHMGSSAILSRAAVAGKPILASDEGLIAKRVREHGLGRLFPTDDSAALGRAMMQMAAQSEVESEQYREAALRYARSISAEAFQVALVTPLRDGD